MLVYNEQQITKRVFIT